MADRRITIPQTIDLFTYTAAILNYLVLWDAQGHEHDPIYSLSVYACFSGQFFLKCSWQKIVMGEKSSLCRVWM